ncbi:hypothetical protein ACED30_06305, partial [Vibrio splendidus]|uniref:hypothetical protein n=1 Tax=Vibrio splendidus TaxID=29497 RepID=UPI00352C5E4B
RLGADACEDATQNDFGAKKATKTTQTHPAFIKKTFNTLSHDLLHLNKITNHLTKNPKAS